ncbi:ArnT family glycosyltransferase [Pontibacter chitinilyticus]|uniref:ArnT family glycosyltransferase n=1 Tax=Pontibacter chitinilyticus TaxID=2674989 RepID=UPI00321A365A
MNETTDSAQIPAWMLNRSVQIGIILLVLLLTFFVNLGYLEPSLMEARNFITAREIVSNGHWLVPTMNGYVRLAKPPLPTWMTAWAGMVAGDIENVAALRLPAALMDALLVFFFYALAGWLTKDKLLPFIAALILSTSFLVINIGRQGTWDIYCHSFMVGALWLMVKGWQQVKSSYGLFLGAGLLLGLSFLSKGPIAFYTLLIPFLASYSYAYGLKYTHWKGMVLLVVACVVVSVSWPLYIYLYEPESLAMTMRNESQAWVNRHVQPFWYYWMFPVQAGIWVLFIVAALAGPYASKRIQPYGKYKFLLLWVVLTIVLLSLTPEKKERYLLPAMVPMALLAAHYVRYLIGHLSPIRYTKADFRFVLVNAALFALAAFAFPVAFYVAVYKTGQAALWQMSVVMVACCLAGAAILYFATSRKMPGFFLAVIAFHTVAVLVAVPFLERAVKPPGNFHSLKQVREIQAIRGMDMYAVDGMNPMYIWDVGQPVDTLSMRNQHLELPPKLPAVVFSTKPISESLLPQAGIRVQQLGAFQFNAREPAERYYLQVLSERSASPITTGNAALK